MLPWLQIVIRRQEFADFSTLEYLATRVERSYIAKKNYRLPLPLKQSIFPDLAYCAPKEKTKNPTTIAATKKGKSKPNKRANVNLRDSVKNTAIATGSALTANFSTYR